MKWIPFVERFEDMSPDGKLRIQRQEDGDVIVTILASDRQGRGIASIEFCAPMTGGGQSEKTWYALIALAEAIEQDNETRKQPRA
jgi:hypothetical protein